MTPSSAGADAQVERQRIALTVNGRPRVVDVLPFQALLDVLRDDLGLTGTKECCLVGECGACTVLLDGRAVDSCLVLGIEADGADVRTVEGLAAADGSLSSLQQAFLDTGAVQCGFCIPGHLVAAHALLEEHPHPTRHEIEEGLAGNLCRCACYEQIFEAVEAAAAGNVADTTTAADAARAAGGVTAGAKTNAEGLDQ